MSEDKDLIPLFIHQNQLMWSRLKMIGVIQLASLTAAYSLKDIELIPHYILLIGFFMTFLMFNLHSRDTAYRDNIKINNFFKLDLQRRWYSPFKGKEISFFLFVDC